MIHVIIADDHPLVRAGMKHLLQDCDDVEFSGEVENGLDLVAILRKQKFDVVLMDLFMPGRNGLELIKQIKNENPTVPVLVLSTHKEDIYAIRSIKAGAAGYICKDYAASELVTAIRKVASGGCYISAKVAELMAKDMQSTKSENLGHTLLSDREYQVFLLIANGFSSSEIAQELNLSIKTISTHKARIKEKTNLANTSEITRYAIKHQLISDITDSNQTQTS